MLIDSHCHLDRLDLTSYDGNLALVLTAAHAQGVGHVLCVGIDSVNSPRVVQIANKYPHVSASIGIHPTEIEAHELTIAELIKMADHPKVVAIGETGLDYYHAEGDMEWQRERFRRHIRVAREMHKPLIVHTRQAREDTLRILAEEKASDVGGVLHCFTESWEMAEQAIGLNFYISFSGIVTFRNATELQSVVKQVPLKHMLIETDAPYLAPVPYRGKPNEPAYVRYVAEAIAHLKDESVETVAKYTTNNFFDLFKNVDRGIYDKEIAQ